MLHAMIQPEPTTSGDERLCSSCGKYKQKYEFGYRSNEADHLARRCRECVAKDSGRRRTTANVKHYEEKYQNLLTQKHHPGYIYRCRDSDRNGQQCRAVLFTRYNKVVVEFEDGHRIATSQIHLRRVKES